MRTLFLMSICLLFIVPAMNAQDTIIKRNNEVVLAKILEINQTQVKYKRFNFQEGPLYILNKNEVKTICYAGGQKDEFQQEQQYMIAPPANNYYAVPVMPQYQGLETWGGKFRYKGLLISEREAHYILEQTNDPKIIALTKEAKKAKALQYIGFAGIPLGISTAYLYQMGTQLVYNSQTSRYTANKDKNTYLSFAAICGTLAIACPVESVIFKFKRNNCNIQAIRLYNQKF